MACFENFLKYLGKNAYIIISMDGTSFCVAGRRAFRILSTNSLRVIAINSIGDFVLFLGKVFVVVATVLIAIELIQVKINSIFIQMLRNQNKLCETLYFIIFYRTNQVSIMLQFQSLFVEFLHS
jgi:hypothetical protein